MKSFEADGVWFLPQEPDSQIAGRITFSKKNGLDLQLFGTFRHGMGLDGGNYPEIRGIVSQSPYGKCFTLFKSHSTNLRISMPGVSLEKIRANHAFVGADFIASDEALFDTAMVYFANLGVWMNYSGLRVDHLSHGVKFEWTSPEQKTAEVDNAIVSVGFNFSTSGGPRARIVSLEETPSFTIRNDHGSTAETLHSKYVGPLARLMTFATDTPSILLRYQVRSIKTETSAAGYFDRLYTHLWGLHKKPKQKRPRELLFALTDVPKDFESFIQSWYRFADAHPDFCSLFFAYGYEERGYLESRFLFRMLALQCLSREQYPNHSVITAIEFARDTFLNKLPNNLIPKLSIPSTTEIAFPALISSLLDDHWDMIKPIVGASPSRFIEVAFASLNYVNNRGAMETNAVTGANLYWLIERISAVTKICVLRILGFSDAHISKTMTHNAMMAHLQQSKSPWGTPEDNAE